MVADGGNPAFPRAIPHAVVIIDLLLEVVLFGVFSWCLRAVSRGGSQTPSGGISKGCPGAFWKFFPRIELDKRGPLRGLILGYSTSNPRPR